MIKPNKDEIVVIIIMVAMVIGFMLGVLSTKSEMRNKEQDIETLLEIIETQEELIDRLLE